jgi:exopolyphosphatase/guanosine-5'-triphosphate,3'-diphosphate pyrophosphatase
MSDVSTVAGIDLGSNSFHMIVVRREADSKIHVLDKIREPVRLAAGLNQHRELTADALERGWTALERMGERLRGLPRSAVRAVGTNTLRQAKNGPVFLDRGQRLLGHPIEIISGAEEARLIFVGVAHSDYMEAGRRLVMDIGGGSTEFIIGEGFTPQVKHSLFMGCVSFSQRYFGDDRLNADHFEAAELAAAKELRSIREEFRRTGWDAAFGASGTIRSVGQVVRENGWSQGAITREAVERLKQAIIDEKKVSKLSLRGLDPERAPVFPGGVAVLLAAFRSLEIGEMHPATGALREGLAYELLGRRIDQDVRDRTVVAFEERHRVDRSQSRRVRDTALRLFEQLREPWELQWEDAARFLGYAAALHEIGMSIAYTGYHKHDAYIIENAEMPGFSRDEQAFLAALLRAHRRKIRRKQFKDLPREKQQLAMRLSVILRLAVTLHRSRTEEALPPVVLTPVEEQGLLLRFPPGWLNQHPLLQADLASEAEYLSNLDVALHFV